MQRTSEEVLSAKTAKAANLELTHQSRDRWALRTPAERTPIFTNVFWEGIPPGTDDYVISADEKTSIQARRRKQPTLPSAPSRPIRVDQEYFCEGAWTDLAGWDVHRAKVFGRCEVKSGIAPVDRRVAEVMNKEPYKPARRVFWTMDNCSAHRDHKTIQRLLDRWPHATLIQTPINASWPNQVEIYFSIVQRRILTTNDFLSGRTRTASPCLPEPLRAPASPCNWSFTRRDLHVLLAKIAAKRLAPAA
jgi:hypothetical protein